jgi:hypothetical protein
LVISFDGQPANFGTLAGDLVYQVAPLVKERLDTAPRSGGSRPAGMR